MMLSPLRARLSVLTKVRPVAGGAWTQGGKGFNLQ